MGSADSETVPCHYCGVDIEVPPERTRFEAFTTHFQSEHVQTGLAASRQG